MADSDTQRAILLLSCPDTRGIVAEVSYFITTYNGNILDSQQHSDPDTKTFFMRVEWDLAEFTIPAGKIASAFEPIAEKYAMDWRIEFSSRQHRMAIFVSQYDHCLYDLILRNREGETHADIRCVIGNHGKMQEIADIFDIPFYHMKVTKSNKAEVEKQQLDILEKEQIDVIVLARYMQILSDDFVSHYPNQIINIHHSFLPAFIGAKPYHQAYQRGVKIIGATSHYVTADLDEGPIIAQDVARISHRDSVKNLVARGRDLEKLVLTRAVKLHLEHRILPYGNKTVVFD